MGRKKFFYYAYLGEQKKFKKSHTVLISTFKLSGQTKIRKTAVLEDSPSISDIPIGSVVDIAIGNPKYIRRRPLFSLYGCKLLSTELDNIPAQMKRVAFSTSAASDNVYTFEHKDGVFWIYQNAVCILKKPK